MATTAEKMFGNIRVKAPGERYSREKSVGMHIKTGRPVADERGNAVMLPSELENAKAGVLFKRLAQKSGIQIEMTGHEQELLASCFEDCWCGKIGSEWHDSINGNRCKALIDDATSGGVYATPIWFDENLVSFPLLGGELFPF